MEVGEGSGSNLSDEEVWAKLIPSNSCYKDVELRAREMSVYSEIKSSSSEKREWCKITRNEDLVSATILNKSYGAILVDDVAVHDSDTAILNCDSKIVAGPDACGFANYKFEAMPYQDSYKKQLKILLDADHAKCCICLNIWHDVVTVAPCLHNFCNGCFSEWLRRSQENHLDVLCPQCRGVVKFVGRNHFLHCIEEDILKADSALRRSEEEMALLDAYASIKSPLVLNSGIRPRHKRVRSAPEEDNNLDPSCSQCVAQFAGFRCNRSTVHLQCHSCGGMMPARGDINVPQHCLGCDRAFCAAYWHAQGVNQNDSRPICSPGTFQKVSERTISRIPPLSHERNRHEQDITERCIRQMGRSLQELISDWITKFDNRELDRTRMPLNHAERISAQTHICSDCYDKLVSYLLYWFRISLPRHYLPQDASEREDCWYGYACRTQHHNEEHALKRNHVCRPTRGSHM